MNIEGYKVAESEKALGFVRAQDVRGNVGILWLPLSKIESAVETDSVSRKIVTNKGERVGVPMVLTVCDVFCAKLGLV